MHKGLKEIENHVMEVEEEPESTHSENKKSGGSSSNQSKKSKKSRKSKKSSSSSSSDKEAETEAHSIIEKKDDPEEEKEPIKPKASPYKAAKGDEADLLLAEFLRDEGAHLEVVRIGPGKYMFGSKKISAKVMNGKLFVRIGGGYQTI